MHKFLVLDANQRSALAIIRSLGRRGFRIIAADHRDHSLGAASKYTATAVRYSDPATLPRAFAEEVIAAADRLDIDFIIPATDLTTMLLVSQPDLCKSERLMAPAADSYEALTNKARLFELAAELDIPAPETRIANTPAAVVDAAHDLGFPVVLKPARSRYLKDDQVLSTSVQIVRNADSLWDVLRDQKWLGDIPCLVQTFVAGHGAGVFALYAPSGAVAWFAHRRVREKPPTGGVSVLSESAPINPAMQSAAGKLLSATNWTGVAMVEFRIAEDGTPFLMEVNGRFWGSLQLAIDCGVDFPWLLYQVSQNLPVPEQQSYALGKRLRWLLGDLDSLIIELGRTPFRFGNKAHAIGAFAKSFADATCQQEILRFDDPRPALAEAWQWMRDLFNK